MKEIKRTIVEVCDQPGNPLAEQIAILNCGHRVARNHWQVVDLQVGQVIICEDCQFPARRVGAKGPVEEIKAITEIMDAVREDWIANDGGLTMAASDLLAFGRGIVRRIENNDARWVWGLDPFDTDTGPESEIISLAQQWAGKKLRRQVEDRLRKDNRFFEQVIDLHIG